MVYLDYSATTFVLKEVLDSYNAVTNNYIGNANSMHFLGIKSKEMFMKATNQTASILGILPKEIIYTSGASESNSTAVKGIAFKYKNRGKHIITSKLEHKSILEVMDFLETKGFEIDYVKLDKNGIVDLKDLEAKIRKDTILVSICAVNSEVGIKQPLKTINQVIKKKNNLTFFHSDMTQALGKMQINLKDVDLASFSSHKIYAPKGIGLLYKKENIDIEPLIFGTTSNTPFRGGTPALPLVVAFSKAIRIAMENLEESVTVQAHTGAQAQQAFFRALVTGHALPLGAADGAKQNGIRGQALVQLALGQGIAKLVNGFAAHVSAGVGKGVAKLFSNFVQHAHCLGHDLRAGAVAINQGNVFLHLTFPPGCSSSGRRP